MGTAVLLAAGQYPKGENDIGPVHAAAPEAGDHGRSGAGIYRARVHAQARDESSAVVAHPSRPVSRRRGPAQSSVWRPRRLEQRKRKNSSTAYDGKADPEVARNNSGQADSTLLAGSHSEDSAFASVGAQ